MKKVKGLIIAVVGIAMAVMCVGCGEKEKDTEAEKGGKISEVYAEGVDVEYDGREHSIAVKNTAEGDRIYYRENGASEWRSENCAYIMPGAYSVEYKVERTGYSEYVAEERVVIRKCVLDGISAERTTVIYDGAEHGIEISGTEDGDRISYSENGDEYVGEYGKSEVGRYRVYYRVERSYGEYRDESELVILPNVSGKYVNSANGVITVTPRTVIINREEKSFEYDENGRGEADGEEIEIKDERLKYANAEYAKMNDDERVYAVEINEQETIYIVGKAKISVEVKFERNKATIKADGETVTTVEGYNCCENVQADGIDTTDVTREVAADAEITEIEITLGTLKDREVEEYEETVVYDGAEHGISIDSDGTVMYKTENGYGTESPKYTEIGSYTVEILLIKTGYLPKKSKATVRIVASITGTYYNAEGVIEISKTEAKVNGEVKTLKYANDRWELDGQAAEKTDGKVRYADKEYTELEQGKRIVVIKIGTQIKVIADIGADEYLTITPSGDGEYTVYRDGEEILRGRSTTTATVTANGEELELTENDDGTGEDYLFCVSDFFDASVVVIVVG